MEIEITTTKKKLSKSIFNQIIYFKKQSFENFECLGFVTVDKTFNKVLLLKNIITNEYRKLPVGCRLYDVTRWKYIIGIWKYSYEIRFETEIETTNWMNQYNSFIKNANQIYI